MNINKQSQRSQLSMPTASVIETIHVPIKSAFDYIQPVSLPTIFPGYSNIPSIVKTNEQEYWIKAGLSRTVTFADGNSALESMLHVDYPNYFSYRIENFTAEGLSNLIEKVEGAWVFIPIEDGKVTIGWKYVITPRNEEAKQIIEAHVLPDFQGMLEQAMKICKTNLESGNI
jgi:hypothetical protein